MSSDNSGKGKPETKQHHKGIIIYRHFQLCYTPPSAFEPRVMREPARTPGNTLGAVFPSTEGNETKFFGFRYALDTGSTEPYPFFGVYHPSGLHLGGHGPGCDMPRCAPHLQRKVLNLGTRSFGPAVCGRLGVMELGVQVFHQQQKFGKGTFPALVPLQITPASVVNLEGE